MDVKRRSKIARLPHRIRHELSVRLDDGDPFAEILAWLNPLPEVQAVLAEHFAGEPIKQQNLSHWKQGGHQDWLQWQDELAAAEQLRDTTAELRDRTPGAQILENLAAWLTVQITGILAQPAPDDPAEEFVLLTAATQALTQLQQGDATRDRLARQRAEFEKTLPADLEEQFLNYAGHPEIKEQFCGPPLTDEERDYHFHAALWTDYVYERDIDKMVHVSQASELIRREYAAYHDLPWDGEPAPDLTEADYRRIFGLSPDEPFPTEENTAGETSPTPPAAPPPETSSSPNPPASENEDPSESLFVVEGRPPRPWKELSIWEQDLLWAMSQPPDPDEKEPPDLESIAPLLNTHNEPEVGEPVEPPPDNPAAFPAGSSALMRSGSPPKPEVREPVERPPRQQRPHEKEE